MVESKGCGMQVDTQWFNEMIRMNGFKSKRELAEKLKNSEGKPLDPAALSRLLHGERQMSLIEAKQLSTLLNAPYVEIVRHAGVDLNEDEGIRKIPVSGYINKKGEVHLSEDMETEDYAVGPVDLPPESTAVQCKTARSELDLIDGWTLFMKDRQPAKAEMIGRLCMYCSDGGFVDMGFISRGYKNGTYNVVAPLQGFRTVDNIKIRWFAPVIWIKPQY